MLRERAKFEVPIFTGDPPPRLPTATATKAGKGTDRLNERAKFYGSLFIPWRAGSPVDVSPKAWAQYIASLEATAESELSEDIALIDRDIARGRLWRIRNVSSALVSDARQASFMSLWRSRNRTLWKSAEPTGSKQRSAVAAKDADVQREIDDLLHSAPRPKDISTIQRAAAAEKWVEENVKALAVASEALDPQTRPLPQSTRGPRAEGLLELPVAGGAAAIDDLIKKLLVPRVAPPVSDVTTAARSSESARTADEACPDSFQNISEKEFEALRADYAHEVSKTVTGTKPPPPLNPEQRKFARSHFAAAKIIAQVRTSGALRSETCTLLAENGLRQVSLLQGAGGVGKSVLLQALCCALSRENLGTMAVTAWTGVASAPFRAPTLCSLLGVDFARLGQEPQRTEQQWGRIRETFTTYFGDPNNLSIFVIDEISFVVPAVLHWVDKTLRSTLNQPDVLFGGVLVILAGDFWQKPPPNSSSLAEILVSADAPVRRHSAYPPTSTMAKGLDIFRHARRTVLTRQMRAADDLAFQKTLLAVRDTQAEQPISNDFIRNLRVLSAKDVQEKAARIFAPIAVLGNQERYYLNKQQAYAYARAHNVPLVRWRIPLTEKYVERLTSEELAQTYANEPGLWHHFVRGAPCMILKNFQPTKAMANGSMAFLHSLSFAHDAPPELTAAELAGGYHLVELAESPHTINVCPDLPDDDDGAGIESLTQDGIVVPITASKDPIDFETSSLYATMASIPRTLQHRGHPVVLAFALTDFKVQGKTLDFLTLSIAPRPFPPHLDMKGFYVMISRVRCADSLRVLSEHRDLNHLRQLRHAPELAVWNGSYSTEGDWDAGLARDNAKKAAARRPAPKRRAYNAASAPIET